MDCPKRKSKEDKVIQEVSLWLPGEDSLLRLCFLICLSPTNDLVWDPVTFSRVYGLVLFVLLFINLV